MRPLLRAAAAIPPLALRGDYWAPVTLLPYLVDALRHAGPGVQVCFPGSCCVPCHVFLGSYFWHRGIGARQHQFHRVLQVVFFGLLGSTPQTVSMLISALF